MNGRNYVAARGGSVLGGLLLVPSATARPASMSATAPQGRSGTHSVPLVSRMRSDCNGHLIFAMHCLGPDCSQR